MSKALWFSIAILLCSALAAEALTCINCGQTELGKNCVIKRESKTCVASESQKCIITKYTPDGGKTVIDFQGCPKSIKRCDATVVAPGTGVWKHSCCNNRDLCNTP